MRVHEIGYFTNRVSAPCVPSPVEVGAVLSQGSEAFTLFLCMRALCYSTGRRALGGETLTGSLSKC